MNTIAIGYLQLVRLRHKYVQRKQLNWEALLSEEDIKNIWKEDLHQLFHDASAPSTVTEPVPPVVWTICQRRGRSCTPSFVDTVALPVFD